MNNHDLHDLKDILSEHLRVAVLKSCTFSDFSNILNYASLPAGKLFRPLLALKYYEDLVGHHKMTTEIMTFDSPLAKLCCSLELHHAYTLAHDDLPSMDNDSMRRGKPSTHAAYSEWQAILAGDALLHLSYHLLTDISHPNKEGIQKFFGWALGAKGLILGQVYDLGGEINKDFPSLLRTHELKTARLIQTSLAGASLLAKEQRNYKDHIFELRLGRNIGLIFQLLDDLSECVEPLSEHERHVSPFINFPNIAIETLTYYLKQLEQVRSGHKCTHEFISNYLSAMGEKIESGLKRKDSALYSNLGKEFIDGKLLPVMDLFK